MSYFLRIFLPIVFCFVISCDKEYNDRLLYFVGDSMIYNWDVESSFPNRITYNLGVRGYRIGDISNVNISDGDCVVLIGTNDLSEFCEINDYCDIYENTIIGLSRSNIYLLSILPTKDSLKNSRIIQVNSIIKDKCEKHSNIIYVDCYDRFLNSCGLLKDEYSFDGLHLNIYGYEVLSDRLNQLL